MVGVKASSAVVLALAGSTLANPVLLRRKQDPLGSSLPSDFTDRGVCVANNYDSAESRKDVWNKARGGELIDAYLNQNSRDKWVQNIYETLFPGAPKGNVECVTIGAKCFTTEQCSEFTEQTADGLFQVFVAISNFHTFISSYHSSLSDTCDDVSDSLNQLISTYGEKDDPAEPLNAFAMFSAALGGVAPLFAANPALSGGVGAASAAASIAGEIYKGEEAAEPISATALSGMMQAVISQTCEFSKTRVLNMHGAVMGRPGTGEDMIPESMTVDEGKGYVHRIAYLLGDGQYLVDSPTQLFNMESTFAEIGRQIKQAIAFQILRLQQKAVMVINTASDCKDGNEVRDPDTQDCYGLMYLNDDGDNLEGGLNDLGYPLWEPVDGEHGGASLGMDKLTTYRNTLDCWKSNNAAMGAAVANEDITSGSLPKCWFGMEVKKGAWEDFGSGAHGLKLDQDFPNYPDGHKEIVWPVRKNEDKIEDDDSIGPIGV